MEVSKEENSGHGNETSLSKDDQEAKKEVDNKLQIIINHWRQRQSLKHTIEPNSSPEEISKKWTTIEETREVQNNERNIKEELNFIKRNFRHRKCKKFYKRNTKFRDKIETCLKQLNIRILEKTEFCDCGLEKSQHSRDVKYRSGEEDPDSLISTHTDKVLPWNFGNVDMHGNYSYLDLPEGTKRFIRLDDLTTQPNTLFELLTKFWGMRKPNMVISITGGNIAAMFENTLLHKQFKEGIIKTAVNTKSWVITDGLHVGSAKEIGAIFQEDLKRSEWSEIENHASIPLIAITPWGVVEGQQNFLGIFVGSQKANYSCTASKGTSGTLDNTLDPYHTIYLLADDGTYGQYDKEPMIRNHLEQYIKTKTTMEGTKGVPTPVVILVLGGDTFTLEKLAKAVSVDMSVVIVNGSGYIANMLAAIYKLLEGISSREKHNIKDWTQEEKDTLQTQISFYKEKGLLSTHDEDHLKEFMTGRHLVKVFGTENGDDINLDQAILNAVFGGVPEISTQLLNLTLAFDRVGVARDSISKELKRASNQSEAQLRIKKVVENALFVSLETGKAEFTQVLLNQDFGVQINFKEFLTIGRLHSLHKKNLNADYPSSKILRSLRKKETRKNDGSDEDSNLLPQVGRIVYCLMGDNYRLLYQENHYKTVCNDMLPGELSDDDSEEAIWHIFIWAVLSNHKEIAELFLFGSNCKIGLALIAFKMLKEMAKVAEVWHESELEEDLLENAKYFQDLAIETLDNLYEMKRGEAYANIVSLIPFHWGRDATPLAIADDAEAKRFIGHACCQTFLNLVWKGNMDLDTPHWKFIPLFAFFPINIHFITFDKNNLSFGSYKENETEDQGQNLNKPTQDAGETAWFRVKNYYTSPMNVFVHSLVTYIIFLALFTHFVITELKPFGSFGSSGITVFEWLTYIWVGSITCQEFAQLICRKSSGPLYNIHWTQIYPHWDKTWYLHERLKFVLHIHKVSRWLSDGWNQIDALMIIMFLISVILRFTLSKVDFAVVRLFFSITLILFYIRLLRFGYIIRSLGPRIMTIKELMKDLFLFILILTIFIISFGAGLQALLYPNKHPSWSLLVDMLWRPYWQMFGELLIDDAGMGRDIGNINCTSDRALANQHPELYEYCYTWMPLVLLAVFMMITNILLLNLLIAIFSNSFEKIEREALVLWRYYMYDLIHEYYRQVWLPPPLNLVCYLANFVLWILKWLYMKINRACNNRVHAEQYMQKDPAQKTKRHEITDKRVCCSYFHYDTEIDREDSIDHFKQKESMRNKVLEKMAYKRCMQRRKKNKEKESKVKDMLDLQPSRQNMKTELRLRAEVNDKIDNLTSRLDVLTDNMAPILQYVERRSARRTKSKKKDLDKDFDEN